MNLMEKKKKKDYDLKSHHFLRVTGPLSILMVSAQIQCLKRAGTKQTFLIIIKTKLDLETDNKEMCKISS